MASNKGLGSEVGIDLRRGCCPGIGRVWGVAVVLCARKPRPALRPALSWCFVDRTTILQTPSRCWGFDATNPSARRSSRDRMGSRLQAVATPGNLGSKPILAKCRRSNHTDQRHKRDWQWHEILSGGRVDPVKRAFTL